MLKWDIPQKIRIKAKIVIERDKPKDIFKSKAIEKFCQEIKKIDNRDAFEVILCLEMGKLIKLQNGEIQLIFDLLKKEPEAIITNNQLYSLLEDIVKS